MCVHTFGSGRHLIVVDVLNLFGVEEREKLLNLFFADVMRFWQVRVRHARQLQHHVLVAIQALTMGVLALEAHFRVQAVG